jgi:hypothetical protein
MINGDAPSGIQTKPHVMYSSIVFSSIFAVSHHIWLPPGTGNSTTAYQYGNLILDLIGQESSKSKARLVILDAITLLLQLLWLSALEKSQGLRAESQPSDSDEPEPDQQNSQVEDITDLRHEISLPPSIQPGFGHASTSSILDISSPQDLGILWIVDVVRYYQEYLRILQVHVKTRNLDLERQGNQIRARSW